MSKRLLLVNTPDQLIVRSKERTRKDLILLLGDFSAKVGSNNTGFETNMGKHALGKMFAVFCSDVCCLLFL